MTATNKINEIRFSNLWGGPLSENPQHKFASQHALNIYKSNSIYTFIPKCACSTMRLSIALSNGLISDINKYNWIHSNNETFSANLRELITANFTFVILRNPFFRIASTFLDKIINSTLDTARVKKTLLDMHTNITADELTFKKFIQLVNSKNTLRLDPHWRPQVDFLVYKKYDHYIQFEKFNEEKKVIEEKSDIKIIDARKITLHGNDIYKKINNRNFSNITPSEINKLRSEGFTPSLNSLYDEESKKIISDTFKDDIIVYENCFKEKCANFEIIN